MTKLSDLPLGMRINNPGNIRELHGDNTAWDGEHADDLMNGFEEFTTPSAGIRALGRVLRSYIRQGHVTVRAAIARYAPPEDDNDTNSYLRHVCKQAGCEPDTQVSVVFTDLVMAIIRHEQGFQPYSRDYVKMCLDLQ